MVMNEHYGDREDLPFDLKAKGGPLLFRLAPEASKDEIARASRRLVAELKAAIALCLEKKTEEVRKATPFPAAPETDGPARFRGPGDPIGSRWNDFPFGRGTQGVVFLAEGPAIWLRLMPTSGIDRTWPTHELRETALSGAFNLMPISHSSDIHGIRAEDGFGLCSLFPEQASTTASLAFAFETGEIWSVDTERLSFGEAIPFVEQIFVMRIESYAAYLKSLGVMPPFQWICGLTGVKGFRLHVPVQSGYYRPGPGPQCLSETIRSKGVFDAEGSAQSALYPFFKEIFDRCGLPRPAHLPR